MRRNVIDCESAQTYCREPPRCLPRSTGTLSWKRDAAYGPAAVPSKRLEIIREVLDWLYRYLRPVQSSAPAR